MSGANLIGNPPTITWATSEYTNPPTVSGVISDPTDPGATLGIDIAVDDDETSLGDLVVTATSSNPAVVPNDPEHLVISGREENRNLKIIPTGVGYADITITVKDGDGLTSSMYLNYAASAASVTPTNTRFYTGASDASTAIAIDDDYMFVGNDEDQVIRLYNRSHSGLPVRFSQLDFFDFTDYLGLTDIKDGVPREVDIEASTRVRDRIYWIGSHGNSREEGKLRPNHYRLFATKISGTGASATLTYVGRYDHLRTDLINWDNRRSRQRSQILMD